MKKIQQVLVISFLFLAITFDTAKAQCSIAVNSTTSGSAGIMATSLTISHTVSGSNTILIVRASTRNGDPTSITYNSTSLTKLATKNNSSQYASIWYLINPSSGTYNVVINGASGFAPIIGITSFTGVHQSSPFGTVVSSAFSSNPSLNVSSASGELVIDVVNANTTMTVGAGQTQQYNLHEFVSDGSGSTEAGASSVTMSWSGFSPDGAHIAVPLKPCPSALTASAGTDQTTCSGTGVSIGGSPTATGGTSPYTYSWNPSTGLSSSTVANPTASPTSTTNYTVTVTDNVGATAADVMVVTVNSLPTADAGTDKEICTGSSVAIGGSPTASGGTSPYTYAWSPSTGLNSTTTANPTANPTSTTNYTVTITDNNGCSHADAATVTVNALPTVSAGSNKTTCSGAPVTIGGSPTASGGASPYTYAWSPTTALSSSTVANPDASPTSNTNYTVTVTDNNGCSQFATMSVTVNPLPTASAGADKTICSGSSTSIGGSPTASGGTSPYTYSWSPTTGLNFPTNANPTASPSATTAYTVTVTDNKGCVKTDEAVVTINSLPTADAGTDKNVCAGSSVEIGGSPTASGGASPYTYAWSPSSWLSSTTVANPTSSAVGTITYSVTVTDNNGCTKVDAATVTVKTLPTANAGSNKTICLGSSVSIGGAPTASGGEAPYTYTWNPSAGLNSATVANPSANPTSTSNYTVTVTDNNGCAKTDDVTVTVDPLPIADAGTDKNICTGSSTSIGGAPTASGGTSPYTYSWSPTTGLSSSTSANPTANPTTTTNYTVTVTDFKGCTHQDVVIVNVNPLPTVNAGADQTIFDGETIAIGGSPTASGGSSPYSYVWTPSTTLSSATVSNPDATPTNTTSYTVTVTDSSGCTKNDVVKVTVNPAPMPATFTVTSTANGTTTDGVSLRWAITKANLSAGNSIAFNIPGAAPHTITLTSALPVITKDHITIDGCTQPANGYTGASPKIIINGNNTISKGIELSFSKDSLEVYCLYIKGFTDNAIYIPGKENHIIGAAGKGNVISGNGNTSTDAAIYIKGGTIKGNIIGMDVSGTSAEANTGDGIYASGGLVVIGSSASGEGNLISANTNNGIYLNNTDNSVIKGNKIGTNADGTSGFGNGGNGVFIGFSADNITIGGSAGEGNLISGNGGDGIHNNYGSNAVIKGNKIGTNVSGTSAIANTGNGIYMTTFSNNCTIGSSATGEGNIISGNNANGIAIVNGPGNAVIKGNKIGTDINGTQNIGNTGYGILISTGITKDHQIGGTATNDGNIIAYNGNSGVGIDAGGGLSVDNNSVLRNSIFCNAGSGNTLGIALLNNGNDGIAAPVITSANATSASGTSEAGAIIEIFKDSDNCSGCQGKTFLGTTTANGSGNWTFTGTLSGNITANQTVSTKGTSQFATCVFSVAELVANAGADTSICNGTSTTIGGAPTVTGGTSPYTYAWTPSTGLNSTTLANPTANPTTTTNYTVSVTDVNGLTANDEVTVTVNALPTVIVSPSSDTVCVNDSITLTASGASTYTWSPATGLNTTTGTAVIAKPIVTTNYTVTGTDANGCIGTADVTVTVPCVIITVNTMGLDTIFYPDTITYTISGAGLSGTYAVGGIIQFIADLPSAGNTSTIILTFSAGSSYVATEVLVDLNSSGELLDFRVRPVGAAENTACANACAVDLSNGNISITPCIVSSCFQPAFRSYALLNKKLNGGYYKLTNNTLFFKYENEYVDGTTNYKVYDQRKNEILLSACGLTNQVMKYGDNRYSLNFTSCAGSFVTGQYYTLELRSEKNETYLLKFKY